MNQDSSASSASPVRASTTPASPRYSYCPGIVICDGLCVGPVAMAPGCPRVKYASGQVKAVQPDNPSLALTTNPGSDSTAPPRPIAPRI